MPKLRLRLSAILAGAAIAISPACFKRPASQPVATSNEDTDIVPPGAVHDEPAVPDTEYADLDYKQDGSFTKDGRPFTGTAVQQHSDGKPKGRYQLIDGRFDGIVEEWHPNGVRSTLKMYQGGARHGITTYWDDSGKPIKQVLYEDDEEKEEITDPEALKKIGL